LEIELQKAKKEDLAELYKMQTICFSSLLKKYQDFDTNPGAESFDRILERFGHSLTRYFIILLGDQRIGAIRLGLFENQKSARIGSMFILPEYQNQHLGEKAVIKLEKRFSYIEDWSLDTIKREEKLCHFYEKLGYKQTGDIHKIQMGMDIVSFQKQIRK